MAYKGSSRRGPWIAPGPRLRRAPDRDPKETLVEDLKKFANSGHTCSRYAEKILQRAGFNKMETASGTRVGVESSCQAPSREITWIKNRVEEAGYLDAVLNNVDTILLSAMAAGAPGRQPLAPHFCNSLMWAARLEPPQQQCAYGTPTASTLVGGGGRRRHKTKRRKKRRRKKTRRKRGGRRSRKKTRRKRGRRRRLVRRHTE